MTETRSLTEYEIENILSFIKPQKGIPSDTAMAVVDINKQGLRHQLQKVKIYPEMIPTLSDMIQKQYFESRESKQESEFWWKHNGTKFITPYKRGELENAIMEINNTNTNTNTNININIKQHNKK